MNRPSFMKSHMARRRALTLVELIVGVACLAVLVPMLAASADSVTRPNRERMCAYRLGQLGTAMLQYTVDNDGWLPGSPGTSGAAVIDHYNQPPGPSNLPDSYPSTQTWDWAAPLAPYLDITLDASRANRLEQFRHGHFWCPANDYQSVPFTGGGPFLPPARMISYLTTRNFLLYGTSAPIPPPFPTAAQWNAVIGSGSYVSFPSTYHPRLDQMGSVGDKVFLSDGSRYVNTASGAIDHELNPLSRPGGMFSDGGPTLPDQYLRSYLRQSPFREYSYRHAHGASSGLNVAFYDGHVAWMSEPDSRHPRFWWPSGTQLPMQEMNLSSLALVFHEMTQGRYVVP